MPSALNVPKAPIRLVCIDVDGTLVGSKGEPTDAVWAAADETRRAGIHLAICTARIAIGKAWTWAHRLDPHGWHLFQSGASIVHASNLTTRSTPLPVGALAACTNTARTHDWVLEAYSDFDYVVDDERAPAVDHAALLGVVFKRTLLHQLDGTPVRAQFIVDDAALAEAVNSVPKNCVSSAATSPVMPGWNFVSVTDARVSKASAIRALADLLGISTNEVMMVGDGSNDVPALQAAGFSVAMGNAHPDAKAIAHRIVADVEEDGLAEALALAIHSGRMH